jgi:hypothetical protein
MLMQAFIEPFEIQVKRDFWICVRKIVRHLVAFFHDVVPRILSTWPKVFYGKADYFLNGLLGPALV